MNDQQVVSYVMQAMSQNCPQGESLFKSLEQATGYRDQLLTGLKENNLFAQQFVELGIKRLRCRNSPFYPGVGEFVSMCKPKPEDLGYLSAQDAYKNAVTASHSSKRHLGNAMVLVAMQGRWNRLSDKNFEREFARLYQDAFERVVFQGEELPLIEQKTNEPKQKFTAETQAVGNTCLHQLKAELRK